MKRLLYILICILPLTASAQFTQGIVRNESGKALQGVIVVNKRTLDGAVSDDNGYYKLKATYGDTIIHMMAYYATKKTLAAPGMPPSEIKLEALAYTLEEVEILPELEKYEKEHEEMLHTYKKSIQDAERKPKVIGSAGTMAGITIDGVISDLAARISGQKKKDKHFLESFKAMEMQKYIAIRYNPDMVMKATGTTRDSAITFINANPMEQDYALKASMLELMMWIREHYAIWAEPGKQTQPHRSSTD